MGWTQKSLQKEGAREIQERNAETCSDSLYFEAVSSSYIWMGIMVKVWGGAGRGWGGGGEQERKEAGEGKACYLFKRLYKTYYHKCRKILIYREAVVGSQNLQLQLQYHAKYMGSRPMQYIKGKCRAGVPPVPDH